VKCNARHVIGCLLVYPAVGLITAAAVGPHLAERMPAPGRSFSLLVIVLECAVVAVAVPFWAAGSAGLRGALARLGLFQLGSTIIAIGSALIMGVTLIAAPLKAQAVVFSFGALLIALTQIADPRRRWRTQLIAVTTGLAMLCTTFYCNPLIELPSTSAVRNSLAAATLRANPLVIVTGSVYKHDFMRGRPDRMYEYCVIGPYYPFRYPNWAGMSFIYVAMAAAIGAVSTWIRRRCNA